MAAFRSGELWQAVQRTSASALDNGDLLPLATSSRIVPDAGMDFLVRIVESLARKPQANRGPDKSRSNPFLPYDPGLFVTDISDTHLALLNKFMVVHNHLLIVTRDFQPQDAALEAADFQALARCLWEYASVGFYNSGTLAGASQPHRHLQLIPLPLDARLPKLPLEARLPTDETMAGKVQQSVELPFAHRWWMFGRDASASVEAFAEGCQEAYGELVRSLGWTGVSAETPYNLQVTRRWMMLVPRRAECFAGASLNAMAYLGALLVHDRGQFDQLVAAGPMAALVATAGTLPPPKDGCRTA